MTIKTFKHKNTPSIEDLRQRLIYQKSRFKYNLTFLQFFYSDYHYRLFVL